MRIHREGRVLIPLFLIVLAAIVVFAGWWIPLLGYLLSVPALVFWGLIVYFFRHPHREIPVDPRHLLAPCDGKVVVIEQIEEDRYFHEKRIQLSIFMSPLNVHTNRAPIGGQVAAMNYYPGKYLMAFNPKSSQENEQTFLVLKQGELELGVKQIAGFLARRIRYYVKTGDTLRQGEEFGFIKFGSRVDLLIPTEGWEICVGLGDKVKGGLTVVARAQDD